MPCIITEKGDDPAERCVIRVGEIYWDQLCTGAELVNLLNIKGEKGKEVKRKGGIYRGGLIGNPAGGVWSLCNHL